MANRRTIDPQTIPNELKCLKHWVNWHLVRKAGSKKSAKVPFGKTPGNWNEPKNWLDFSEAWERDSGYVGIVLSKSGLVGIDIDSAFDDDGELLPSVKEVIDVLPPTWGDISPSGNGFHLYLYGGKPKGMPCKLRTSDGAVVEVYDDDRFLTVTGELAPGMEKSIAKEDGSLQVLWQRLNGRKKPDTRPKAKNFTREYEEEELTKAFTSYVSSKPEYTKLWAHGDISEYNDDHSSADLALCNVLAHFMQGDAELIDKKFRQSALMRSKWDEKRGESTYGARTIDKALTGLTKIYRCPENDNMSELQMLVDRYTWVKHLEVFVDLEAPHLTLRRSAITSSHLNIMNNAGGKILGHPKRKEVLELGFFPGRDRIVVTEQGSIFNQWAKPTIIPTKGNVDVFLEAMEHTYPDAKAREVMIWFMAHTTVRPEIKIRWAPVIIGVVEGSGKSIWFDVAMKELVGRHHFRAVTQGEVLQNFNEYLARTKLIVFEEIWAPGLEGLRTLNNLKPVITNDTLTINAKYLPTYSIQNFTNCVFFSNHPDALSVSSTDRRYFVYETPAQAMEKVTPNWGAIIVDWLHRQNGLPALAWYFENEVDLDTFNPSGHAPHSRDKERMMELAAPSLHSWLDEALDVFVNAFRDEYEVFLTFRDVNSKWKDESGKTANQGQLENAFRAIGWKYFPRYKPKSGGQWGLGGWACPELAAKLDSLSKGKAAHLVQGIRRAASDF